MSDQIMLDERVEEDAPRIVQLSVARVDPWSVTKVAFLLSVAMGIAGVVATMVVWFILDAMNVFGTIEDFLISVGGEQFVSLLDWVHLPSLMSFATIFAVVNVVLLSAIALLMALLYNIIASLVGGVRVSLMDE